MEGISIDYCHVCKGPTAWLLKAIRPDGWAVEGCTNCCIATHLVPLAPGIDHTTAEFHDSIREGIDLLDYGYADYVSLN